MFSFPKCHMKSCFPWTGCRCHSTRFAQSNDQDEVVFAKSIYSDDLIQTYQVRISSHISIHLFLPSRIFKEYSGLVSVVQELSFWAKISIIFFIMFIIEHKKSCVNLKIQTKCFFIHLSPGLPISLILYIWHRITDCLKHVNSVTHCQHNELIVSLIVCEISTSIRNLSFQ
jgi:hypothetical protein